MEQVVVNKIMEKVKRIQELRRSNAATAIPSKKKYTRKTKHKNRFE
jgi:vacuolar-type H+-ATPase subunit F/Vma7